MGRAVLGGGVVRAALGLVGVGVLAVVEEAGTCMKQTSGGSGMGVSLWGGFRGRQGRRCTYWILTVEDETEAIDLVFVQRIVIKDSDVHLPFFEVVCFDYVYARREFLFGLSNCQLCMFSQSSHRLLSLVWLPRGIAGRGGSTVLRFVAYLLQFLFESASGPELVGQMLTLPNLFAANIS